MWRLTSLNTHESKVMISSKKSEIQETRATRGQPYHVFFESLERQAWVVSFIFTLHNSSFHVPRPYMVLLNILQRTRYTEKYEYLLPRHTR